MGKVSVAEFVKDEATLDLLTQFRVDLVQGDFLDRPVADHPALQGNPIEPLHARLFTKPPLNY